MRRVHRFDWISGIVGEIKNLSGRIRSPCRYSVIRPENRNLRNFTPENFGAV